MMKEADRAPKAEAGQTGPVAYPIAPVIWLLFVQSILFGSFVSQRLDVAAYLVCHVGICLLTGILGWRWARRSAAGEACGRIAIVIQLVALTGLAGPFGTVSAMGLFMPRSVFGGRDLAASVRRPELAPRERMHAQILDHRLRLRDAHAIRPLLDVVIEGTRREKLDALSLISRHYAPGLSAALTRALHDQDNSVRVLAATAAARLHGVYTKRIGAFQTNAEAEPHQPQRWHDLGQARLAYGISGLLEASRANAEVSQAYVDFARAEKMWLPTSDQPRGSSERECKPKLTSA